MLRSPGHSAKAGLLLLAVVGLAETCHAFPRVSVGANVPAAQRVSMSNIDHAAWDALLRKYVDRQGNVAYAAWQKTASDSQLLDRYLVTLSQADEKLPASKAAQLAFWINAYNAVTIKGILREYPTTSIRNHTARLYGYNIWKDLRLVVGGEPISLEDIEHKRLRGLDEPRIHFAIVCASRSCPRLLGEAYQADKLEQQLKTNAIHFFAQPANFQFDAANRRFQLSSILKWFADDFGNSQAARLRQIAPYLSTRAAYDAAVANTVDVTYLDYNWELNDQTASR